ncbi:hypothetical protein DBV05_g5625 [Lasiodiplodia theobromae]|uniref:Xylanolytic transcriptional activator regulatory domain-containing protein n=1 Tax=Lasiodiplodia theobromae TaxID=45133 RepID=A0A5N5DCZ6_9PEZI|nr:hypothetical protein DBV05_g5625 [Lasiodiplodia theobromae]
MHIFNNIRTTHAAAGTELFYGASSVFSLLQHLDIHLPIQATPVPQPQPGVDEVHDGDESIQRYNYQNIAFDCIPQPTSRAVQSVFISQDLARASLRNFLLTAYHLTPFLEPEKLSLTLEKLYIPSENSSLEQADRALVVVAMATGAALAKDNPCREHLLAQARAETESMLYAISLRAVQVALLMAQCEFESGNPNISYLQLGSAVRKAFAAGIHRATSLEAKQTMWALYCAESMVCFMIGRNPSMTEDDIVAPTLEQPSYMGSFVRLCTIVRSAYSIYRPDTTMTVANDISRANSVYQQLLEFSSTLKEDLSLEIGGQLYALTGEALSWHVTISYLYHFTVLIVYRPFVLLASELRRRQQKSGRKPNLVIEAVDLNPAVRACLNSAQSIVLLSESLFSLQIGAEGFYNHAFFLESACFVLVLAAVYDHGNENELGGAVRERHVELVRAGLALVRRLGSSLSREPIRSIAAALEQMLARVNALRNCNARRGASNDAVQREEGVLRAAADAEEEGDNGHNRMSPAAPAFGQGGAAAAAAAAVPLHGGGGGESSNDDVLDELWSMTDWDMSFPLLDFQSYAPR